MTGKEFYLKQEVGLIGFILWDFLHGRGFRKENDCDGRNVITYKLIRVKIKQK
jgi:hypothetical protein